MNIRRWLVVVLVGLSVLIVRSSMGEEPKSATDALKKGDSFLKKGDHDAAISAFTEVIRLDPKKAEAYWKRGRAYEEKGNHEKAIADCSVAIRLDSKNAPAYYDRGRAYGKKGELDSAIAELQSGHSARPDLYQCILQPWLPSCGKT